MKNVQVKFKKLHKDAKLPTQGSVEAGGWDVYVTEIELAPNMVNTYICKLGFALEVPKGYRVILVPRSSITKTNLIQQNSPGLGDSDYRGEYQYRFKQLPYGVDSENENLLYPIFPIEVGDRIGQIYLEEVIDIEFIESDLTETERGEGGFGSTGKQ